MIGAQDWWTFRGRKTSDQEAACVPLAAQIFMQYLCHKIANSGCAGTIAHRSVADVPDVYGIHLEAQDKHRFLMRQCPVC